MTKYIFATAITQQLVVVPTVSFLPILIYISLAPTMSKSSKGLIQFVIQVQFPWLLLIQPHSIFKKINY
jgi:hypothetical protein